MAIIEFDGSGAVFAVIGVAALAAAMLPRLLQRLPISMPMVFVAAGCAGFAALPSLPDPSPAENETLFLHLTEVCVIVSLMGAGLALNRPVGWSRWSTTWRLLGIAMPLTMLCVGALGWAMLGFGIAGSLLLAAALAPTDPVLATEVQVSEPVTDAEGAEDDETRFALTSEAGLNDGLAFPFTYAAIAVSVVGAAPGRWLGQWLVADVLWRTAAGVAIGLTVGIALRWLFFSAAAERIRLPDTAEGFVALAATFLAYGLAESAEGYGFLAVFICGCTIRAAERSHGYHGVLHKFVEQIERLLTVAVLILLGGAVGRGLLADVGVAELSFAALVILVVRPAAGWLSLSPGKTGPRERFAIAAFGIRGVGTLFYIAYALGKGQFDQPDRLWAIAALVVLASIFVHGAAATPAMSVLDRARRRRARRDGGDAAATAV